MDHPAGTWAARLDTGRVEGNEKMGPLLAAEVEGDIDVGHCGQLGAAVGHA
jgi:hypothetical protein